MKKYLFLVFLIGSLANVFGQDNPDVYYQPNYHKNRPINLPNMDFTQQRWYFGIDGGLKVSSSTLDNSMGGLLAKSNNNDVVWSVQLGYNFDNKWETEIGYYPNPTTTTLQIITGRVFPYIVEKGITLQTIPIRFKKNIFTLDKATKTASIWIGGGLLISPNSKSQDLGKFELDGSTNIVRGLDGKVASFDTLRLIGNSQLTNKNLVQLEGLVELRGKIAEGFYINIFVRGVYGANGAVQTDINYSINSQTQATANHYTNGFNYNLGIGFRYDYAKKLNYKSKLEDN